MASIDALIGALKQFEGTLIFISHDVYFIRELATSVLHISAGQLTPYAGNYDYYLTKSGAVSERAALVAGDQLTDSRPDEALAVQEVKAPSVFKSKEQKRKEAQERQAKSEARKEARLQAEGLEKEIAVLEARQRELSERLENGSGGDVMRINRELMEVTSALERKTAEWEKAAEVVATFA
jgi:ATP-binding cassette subfamily F protein 3